jgi:hypothetical protein
VKSHFSAGRVSASKGEALVGTSTGSPGALATCAVLSSALAIAAAIWPVPMGATEAGTVARPIDASVSRGWSLDCSLGASLSLACCSKTLFIALLTTAECSHRAFTL